jgi:hypothetical protein
MQISAARSIVETFAGQPNVYTVAGQIAASAYKGVPDSPANCLVPSAEASWP